MSDHEPIHASGQLQPAQHTRARAKARITVHSSETRPYDQTVSPALMEICLSESFNGDIEGESSVRALQVLRDDQSASLVSVQRFHGNLGGRQGTFVLQGSEIVENGKIRAGTTVKGAFWCRFGLRNMGITQAGTNPPNAGHHHLLIDVNEPLDPKEPIPQDKTHLHFGAGQTEAVIELPPGKHTLQLVLGDAKHYPFNPPVISKKNSTFV